MTSKHCSFCFHDLVFAPADLVLVVKNENFHYRQGSAASRAEAGCSAFDVAQSLDDPNTLVLHEEWADQAALDAHFKTPHFEQFGLNGLRKLATARVGHRCKPF